MVQPGQDHHALAVSDQLVLQTHCLVEDLESSPGMGCLLEEVSLYSKQGSGGALDQGSQQMDGEAGLELSCMV